MVMLPCWGPRLAQGVFSRAVDFRATLVWVGIAALLLYSCVTLGQLLNLSILTFLHV